MYLQFKPISENDIEKIAPYFTLRSNKTCDSIFLDVFLWKDFYNVKFDILDEKALFLTMEIDNTLYASLPMCKEEDLEKYFYILKEFFNKNLNTKLKIYLADENSIKILNLDKSIFNVIEIEDAKDYIYSAEALKNLSGKKLRKKKNHINAFLKENEGNFYYKNLTCSDSSEIIEFLSHWRKNKTNELEEQLDAELTGIKNILKNCKALNVNMAGVYVNEKLEAFSIASYNEKEKMAVINIEKANPEIRGLYPYINQQFIINGFPNAEIVNREDDLGLEGLRKAKLSYDPIEYAIKFRIEEI